MNGVSLKIFSSLYTPPQLGEARGGALLSKALHSFLTIFVLLFGLPSAFSKPHLERLKYNIVCRLAFMSQLRFQTLLWFGAALLIPDFLNGEAPLEIGLVVIVAVTLAFMVVMASGLAVIKILLDLHIGKDYSLAFKEARPTHTTRSLTPALRPPLLSA